MSRQVKIVEKRIEVPDWKSRAWQEMHDGIVAEANHHVPQIWGSSNQLGDSGFASSFSCKICRTTWPCRFIEWAHKLLGGRDETFMPLRLQVVGEQVDGHGVRLPDGAWIRVEQPRTSREGTE